MIAQPTRHFLECMPPQTSGRLPDRKQRFPNLIGMPEGGHETLSNLKIAVAGCGAVGRTIAIDLARLGIARLYLIDPKAYKEQSLLTQQIMPSEIGRSKAESTAQACAEISRDTGVFYALGRFETLDHLALKDVDVVIMAGDNLNLESALGEWTSRFRIPLIHAAVHGETLVAQVNVYANQNAESPCPCCGWGAAEWEHHARETTFACDPGNAASQDQQPTIATQPTTSTPSLCGIAANLASTQMLRYVLGLGRPVGDTSLQFCAYTNATATSPLAVSKACPTSHLPYTHHALPSHSHYTLNDLLRESGSLAQATDPPTFEVGNAVWAEAGVCNCEGATTSIARFVATDDAPVLCKVCNTPIQLQPFFTHQQASLHHLGEALDLPISDLCDSSPRWIAIRNTDHAILFS